MAMRTVSRALLGVLLLTLLGIGVWTWGYIALALLEP